MRFLKDCKKLDTFGKLLQQNKSHYKYLGHSFELDTENWLMNRNNS